MTERLFVDHHRVSVVFVLSLVVILIGVSLAPATAQAVEVSIPDIQHTDDPAGDSPRVGQIVTVDGVVTALDPRDAGLDGYFIEEPEGGPWSGVYVADPSGNRPAVGDRVQVTGRVDEVADLTAVRDLEEFTVVSNDNPAPAARGITANVLVTAGEPWESVRVAMHGVTVAGLNPGAADEVDTWLIGDVTGASVPVGYLLGDYAYTPVEGDELVMVRGIAHFSSDAFRLEPVSSADVLDQVQYTSIYDIETVPAEADDDASPLEGEVVTTAGVVTAVFSSPEDGPEGGVRYVIEDVRGGQWSGVWALDDAEGAPPRGAHVELTGTVRESFGRTELYEVAVDSIVVHSVDNVLPAAAEITTRDINTDQPSAESYEGVLMRTGQVTVSNANPDAPDDFGEWLIRDWSGYDVRVDDLGGYTYEPVEADELAFVQGVVDFSFNQFKVQPRDDDDIGTSAVTIGQARQRPIGESVALEGVVTVPDGVLDAGFAIQDGTGGIYVFHADGFGGAVELGDVVYVEGALAEVNGRLQIEVADPEAGVEVTGVAPVPSPLPRQTDQIGEASEGWLVAIEGTVVEKEDSRLVVDDGSGPAEVVVAAGTGIDLSDVAAGQLARIVGLSGQFDAAAPFDNGYRVMPRSQADVNPTGPAVLTPTPSITPTFTPTATEQPEPAVAVEPAGSTISVGDATTTAIQAREIASLYGVELQLEFDPAIVQVVDADEDRPGVQVAPGSLLTSRNHFVAVNRADNEAGTIRFAASLLNPEEPFDGSGELAAIAWRGVAPGTTALQLTDVALSDEDGGLLTVTLEDGTITVRAPTPTPTLTPTPEVIPTPTCDGGVCGGTLVIRATYDYRCDGSFGVGVDHGIGGARLALRYDSGAEIVAETTDHQLGYAYLSGVNLPAGATATVSIQWPEVADGALVTCPNSRESVTLTGDSFGPGMRTIHFRARKVR